MSKARASIASSACLALLVTACGSGGSPSSPGAGGSQGSGGTSSGGSGSGGSGSGSGGSTSGSGGGSGGSAGSGGSQSGGATGSGGSGTSSGGSSGSGGSGSGGKAATGGAGPGTGGGTGTGGAGTGTGGAGTGTGGAGTGGTGTGTGGAGTGGGSAGPVTPTVSSNKYRFTFGDVVMEIDATSGARVTSLTLSGTDLIMPHATDLTACDSVFWTSPRSDWKPDTWPPPVAIDNGPYTGSISGTHAAFTGATDAGTGVSMKKDFSADAGTGWISIAYTVNSTKAIKAAPWEVTRVPRGGLAFFPSGTTALTKGPWTTITTSSGTTWVDDAAKTASTTDGSKAYGDGSGGWLAYAVAGNLFLKKFTDTPANQQAPGDGEIGIYPGPTGFLEFEVQGPYTSIAAGGNLPWSMKWRVVKLPSGVTVSAGSATLLDFAKQQAAL